MLSALRQCLLMQFQQTFESKAALLLIVVFIALIAIAEVDLFLLPF